MKQNGREGVLYDVLVKADQFIFLVYFVILYYEIDTKIPISLVGHYFPPEYP